MKILLCLLCSLLLFSLVNSYKLYRKPVKDYNEKNTRFQHERDGDESNENRRQERRDSDDHHDEVDGINSDDLEDAKQQMLDEIKDIKSDLRKKFQSFFNQADTQSKKKEFCPVYMSNGVNWRKMIRETVTGARAIAGNLLGPNNGLRTTDVTTDYKSSSTSEFSWFKKPTDNPRQYRKRRKWGHRYLMKKHLLLEEKRNEIHLETLTEAFKDYCRTNI